MNQQITDIASVVFWINVRKTDFSTTRSAVLKRDFDELWTKEDISFYLEKVNMALDPSDSEGASSWIYEQVNNYMYNTTLCEQNICGTVYLEDAVEGKTPDFDGESIMGLLGYKHNNYEADYIPYLRSLGKLLLRSPLPAVVFTDSDEVPQTFIIEDTETALGFQVNLIMEVESVSSFPENGLGIKNSVSGIIKIKNFNGTDILWRHIIPNSICYENLIMLTAQGRDSVVGVPKVIRQPKYVTNANIKRALFKIDKSNFDYEDELYKRSFNYFNALEKKDLLALKCLFEFPDLFFEEYYSKINTIDTFKFVYEEQKPAYHTDSSCPNLLSDFENFLIPEQIHKNGQVLEYRDWFKQNLHLAERKTFSELFKSRHFGKWDCLPILVDYENSGASQFDYISLDEIEAEIDEHLNKCEVYVRENWSIISSLGKLSYAYGNLSSLNLTNIQYSQDYISRTLRVFEQDYKRPLITLLKEYYRIRFNPELEFEENILNGLGFRRCRGCSN